MLWKRLLDDTIKIEGPTLTQGACRLLDDLGRLFTMTKHYKEAAGYFEKALAGREDHVRNGVCAAPEEPIFFAPELGVADTCRQYGILKQAQGNFEDAEALCRTEPVHFHKSAGP